MLTRPVAVVLLWALTISFAPAPAMPAAAERAIEGVSRAELRAHVEQLASDAFAGRALGHNRATEQYVARALEQAGVAPAVRGYLQPFPIQSPALGPRARLAITGPDGTLVEELVAGPDFSPLPESAPDSASGRLVFAGYGLSAPDWRHDDYRGLDARGAIVVVQEHTPAWIQQTPGLTPAQKSDAASLERKIEDARRHGAAGLLLVRERMEDVPHAWSSASDGFRLGQPDESGIPVAAVSTDTAGRLRRALREEPRLSARLTPDTAPNTVVAHNVLGMIDGRSPTEGLVVVGAHLDHDGTDANGRVLNGADDNASGTAAVLAIAAAFTRAAADGERPARPVVFALWNGEEQGLFGAEWYARAPVPRRRVVANINLDMVGRSEDVPDPGNPRFFGFSRTRASDNANVLHVLGYTYSPDLARIVNRANESVRLRVKEEYDRGAHELVRRSDHWAFLKRGVPAVFLTTGLHPDYHTPDDDTERIDFEKLERIAELAARAAWLAADGEAPRFRAR
jgi:hypothetical protein